MLLLSSYFDRNTPFYFFFIFYFFTNEEDKGRSREGGQHSNLMTEKVAWHAIVT